MLNYIITESSSVNWKLYDLCREGGCFPGEKFTEVSVRWADHRGDLFHYKHSVSFCFFFLAGDRRCFFGQKCDEESVGRAGGQTGGRTLLHVWLQYFFPHICCQRHEFGHVTLLCGKFLFIKFSQLSDCQIDMPSLCASGLSVHTGSVCQ